METEMGPFLFRVDLVPIRRSSFVIVKFKEVLANQDIIPQTHIWILVREGGWVGLRWKSRVK